jgi:hypothetical protein
MFNSEFLILIRGETAGFIGLEIENSELNIGQIPFPTNLTEVRVVHL